MATNVRGRETTARILDAARDAMAERGVEVSLQEIADLAGTSRMTIYRHFETREQLLTTLVLRESSRLAERMTELLSDDWRPFPERLADTIVYVVTTVKSSPLLNTIVSATSAAVTWPQIDVDNRLVEATKRFLLPHFERAASQGVRFRSSPDHALDWTLRVTLLLMTVEPGVGGEQAALRNEVETFVLPSVFLD